MLALCVLGGVHTSFANFQIVLLNCLHFILPCLYFWLYLVMYPNITVLNYSHYLIMFLKSLSSIVTSVPCDQNR